MQIRDVIIVGAGPSGLFSALHLPDHLKVLILEKTEKAAQKLLMSAKGRGNLTNINLSAADYVSDDKQFVQQALDLYSSSDFLQFLDQHSISYQQEENGRILLASSKVSQFHEFLLSQLSAKGIEISYNQNLLNIHKDDDLFTITTDVDTFQAKKIILATGTKSIPKIGSTDIALQIAKSFNLSYADFFPALVGFETAKDLSSLSGSSLIAKGELYSNNKLVYEQTGPILFTHRGISGPVIFNASLYMFKLPLGKEGRGNFNHKKNNYTFKIKVEKADITKRFLAYLGFKQNKLSHYIFTTPITKVRSFDEAKVSGGGINLANLDQNFQIKTVPGMYIIGECLNVTGKTGGYNLQRCRTSGYCCAMRVEIE